MIKIEAIINPSKLEEVMKALTAIGIDGVTIMEVNGFSHKRGHREQYRGAEYMVEFALKTKLEIALSDDEEDKVVATIMAAAKTGIPGDGRIFVMPMNDLVRIRTGEFGEAAL